MPPESGAGAHLKALESLYRSAPINGAFRSDIEIPEPGLARIRFEVTPETFHAAQAANEFQSVHFRHNHVGDNQRRYFYFQPGKGL